MKMKRFTLVLGVLFMGGVLATSMTSCDNAAKDAAATQTAPATNDEPEAATLETEAAPAADTTMKCGEGKCGEAKTEEAKSEAVEKKCGDAKAEDAKPEAAEKKSGK